MSRKADLLSLQLPPLFESALARAGVRTLTPIQVAMIPPMLAARDLIVTAQTGSGKTLAYALPLLQQRLQAPEQVPRVLGGLILVPTRELVAQVAQTLLSLAAALPRRLKIVAATGGEAINPQLMALRGGADIVIATPGRLLDLVTHNALRLSQVRTLVLDEADRLLDLALAPRLIASWPCCRRSGKACWSRPPSHPPSRRWPSVACAIRCASPSTPRPSTHRRSRNAPSQWMPVSARSCCVICCRNTPGRSCWCSSPAVIPPTRLPKN